jgi:hypothetical protein
MRSRRVAVAVLLVTLAAACTSGGDAAKPGTSTVPSAAPTPSTAPSMSSAVVAACTHVRSAFQAQAVRDWNKVIASLEAAWRVGRNADDRQLAAFLPAPGTVGVDDTQTLGEVTDSLTFACGLPVRPGPGSALGAPDRPAVDVSVSAVGGVRIGTAADESERRLRQSLGDADVRDVPSCAGEAVRRLGWGSFSVIVTNTSDSSVLRGWSLRFGVSRVFYRLPYDVQPGDRMAEVLTRVPGAVGGTSEGPAGRRYAVHTDRSPGLQWFAGETGRAGTVQAISFRDPGCD